MIVPEKTLRYEFGTCILDVPNRQLISGNETVFLPQKTFNILCYFLENRSRVLTKEELLEEFWGVEYLEETNLAQQIYLIRKAIKNEETGETYVKTIRKYGYKFTADVRETHLPEKERPLSEKIQTNGNGSRRVARSEASRSGKLGRNYPPAQAPNQALPVNQPVAQRSGSKAYCLSLHGSDIIGLFGSVLLLPT